MFKFILKCVIIHHHCSDNLEEKRVWVVFKVYASFCYAVAVETNVCIDRMLICNYCKWLWECLYM